MTEEIMACYGGGCYGNDPLYFDSQEEERLARMRNKQLTKALKEYRHQELKKLKLLERQGKILDIRRNIKQSIVVILGALEQLAISLEHESNVKRMHNILQEASSQGDAALTDELLADIEVLWRDAGVQECYSRSYEYQLIDSAKYFLDKVEEIRRPDYLPSDQDILRCRVLTTGIHHIEFDVHDAGHPVSFSVFDVGGQRGERRKWIQVFDSVVAILFLADVSSYEQTLREDQTKNRFMEALEIFEQVWKNRFLKNVSILLFMNKMDVLAEKIQRGRSISALTDKYPEVFPNYEKFIPSSSEKIEFLDSYYKPEGDGRKRRNSRGSKSADVNPDLIKTAVYVKHIFMKIVKGEVVLNPTVQKISKDWHQNHSCEYFYTCAVDTNNIQRVLDGCRTLIIRKHLERFGII
ncbi:GNAS-like protein [Mya arenaria]|uniref:Guanine nucleotide-binding protein G(s) subunit alpha n=1 Tax=Mya arenaria TaxID=6604 RepID=A0ABY7EAC9_MYAAR|nr:GNAS-like protein [Mya arenaria]